MMKKFLTFTHMSLKKKLLNGKRTRSAGTIKEDFSPYYVWARLPKGLVNPGRKLIQVGLPGSCARKGANWFTNLVQSFKHTLANYLLKYVDGLRV